MAASHGQSFGVTVGTTSGQFIGPNPRRKALIISAPQSNHVTITTQNPAVAHMGLVIYAADPPVHLCACHVGDWIKQPLFAIADTAQQIVGVIECSAGLGEE